MYYMNRPYENPYYANPQMYQNLCLPNTPMYDPNLMNPYYNDCYANMPYANMPYADNAGGNGTAWVELKDYGPEPFVVNIEEATLQNDKFRIALWTGKYLQLTLMSIKVGGDIGLEVHPNLDQFVRIEQGQGLVKMGDKKDRLDFEAYIRDDYAFIIPAGKWHNLYNTGCVPLKLYSIYAPPQHPFGTVHDTKEIAEAAEEKNH